MNFFGSGLEEIGRDIKTGKTIVKVNPKFYRPAEVDLLIGDPSKAIKELNWKPRVDLEQLCSMMVDADLSRVKNKRILF